MNSKIKNVKKLLLNIKNYLYFIFNKINRKQTIARKNKNGYKRTHYIIFGNFI